MIWPRKRLSRTMDEARATYAAKDFERCVALLAQARDDRRCDAEALHLLSAACRKTGREPLAIAALAEALRLEFDLRATDDAGTAGALLEMLWRQPPERWRHRLAAIEQLGWIYSRRGGYENWGAALLARAGALDPARLPAGAAEAVTFATLRLLDFSKNAPLPWLEQIFTGVVWPWMRRTLAAGRYGLALMLETHAYGNYVVSRESGEHFRRAFGVWANAMRDAGRLASEALAPLPAPAGGGIPAIAFYLHSGSVLGHTQIMLEFLEAHAKLERPLIRPLVFVRALAVDELRARLAALAVPCHELDRALGAQAEADFHALVLLRERLAAEKAAAVVWVSVAAHMAFAFAMRLAPVQIWWAMKYHSLELPEIDGYVTNQSIGGTKLVEGKLWRSAPLASEEWHRPELAARAAELRASYPHAFLFGCIGREEKINSPPFLEAVARILRECPDAGFLWTGRERSAAVQSTLERLGVAGRCHFIGWVDTKLYAQVLDLFLDSFPFPCGFTLYEAMAAGKPVVAYASREAAETGIYGLLAPLLAGETGAPEEIRAARALFANGRLFHCAPDPERYVELALALARDPAARSASGEVNRAFVREFLSDRAKMARVVGRHFVELVQEKTGQAEWH